MAKVVIIGAGSIGFTQGIVRDLLSVPEFRDTLDIVFTDIDKRNLEMIYRICKREMKANGVKATLSATLNRRKALKKANYVFNVVRVGALEAFEFDIKIPLKYGVDQCVGDTLGPGGIMYGQRSVPVLLEFCKDISEVSAPGCLFINHVNPMAINTWACNRYGYGVKIVGLCHGVQAGYSQIAEVLGFKPEELDIVCAGINHQTWFITIKHKGKDLTGKLLKAFERHPVHRQAEKARIDMLRRFGYYSTESNGHLSEYVPWYRKRPRETKKWIDTSCWINGATGAYLRFCKQSRNSFEKEFRNLDKTEPLKYGPEHRGHEHGSYIIESLETGRIYRGFFNVVNRGCITNLPSDAIVEVPGYVDATGINIPMVGDLPTGCAAVCNASISVQRLAMQAAVRGDDQLLRQAMMMDPLTGAVCDPPEIWRMADEMLIAQSRWLPQYKRAITAAKRRMAKRR